MKTFIIHHERAHNTVVGVAALVLTIACGSTTDTVDGSTLDGGSLDGGSLDGGSLDGGSLDGGSFDGGSGRPPGSYVPPIGIPAPGFGIDESHLMYEGASYDYGDGMEPYRTASDGPYTHYIDNTDVGCTNDSNPYGTSATPRCTLPKIYTLPAGSIVEIHGGPYDYGGFETILSIGRARFGRASRPASNTCSIHASRVMEAVRT